MKKDFLLEIGTEELPPKALTQLAESLQNNIEQGLQKAHIEFEDIKWLAAPRRLAVIISGLETRQEEKLIERRGPAVSAAYDDDRNPTKALIGFAKSCGVEIEALNKINTDKGEWFYYTAVQEGTKTIGFLPEIVIEAIKKLPIPKPMRWGDHPIEFIRPVHWVLMLFGKTVVEAEILGIATDRLTYGHRFHAPDAIKIKQVSEYVSTLEKQGMVLVDFQQRRETIVQQIDQLTAEVHGSALYEPELLDEVTAIVEWPKAMLAEFDPEFLTVPKEALICAMQSHQKSFPIVDMQGELLPYFIFVANINSEQAEAVKLGNEKVMRARLADAAFFYQTDLKIKLFDRLSGLKTIVFHEKLGSLYKRAQRIAAISKLIAAKTFVSEQQAERAGLLSKCDLLTDMVYEFPELQGIMGSYYAAHDRETPDICAAIKDQYLPTGSGNDLPRQPISVCVALADKIDLLLSIFSIGLKPTGDKDPFALRRAAIGVVRILLDHKLDIDLTWLLQQAASNLKKHTSKLIFEVKTYILERLKYYYVEHDEDINYITAVMEAAPISITDFDQRLTAVKQFVKMPEADNLAQANKRVFNILRKQNATELSGVVDKALLKKPAEKQLFKTIQQQEINTTPLIQKKDYQAVLTNLAALQQPLDQFFDDVMVATEDVAIKNNRLQMLSHLRNLFLTVADISHLS